MTTLTPSQLKYHIEGTGSNFFDRKTMRFFGDTMQNYGVRGPVTIETWTSEQPVECWELYRRHPVMHGLTQSAYFNTVTFEREYPKQ